MAERVTKKPNIYIYIYRYIYIEEKYIKINLACLLLVAPRIGVSPHQPESS
jgi:hypothetical protein